MEEKEKNALTLLLLAGAGIGGYFLWKYFQGPKDIKKGFNISKITWNPPSPLKGGEIAITCIGINNTAEQLDGYCKIINLDTKQEVFYDHAIVDPKGLKGFTWTTIMPDELKLRFEIGTLIAGKQELNSYQEISIKASVPPQGVITIDKFTIQTG